MSFTVAEIARLVEGTVSGDDSTLLTGFAPAESARPGDLTFAENEAYLAKAEQSAASAILVSVPVTSSSKALIQVSDARVAFARLCQPQ